MNRRNPFAAFVICAALVALIARPEARPAVSGLDTPSAGQAATSDPFEGASGESSASLASNDQEMPAEDRGVQADLRVRAFMEAYADLIDAVEYEVDDVVFVLAGRRVHFRDGRMLAEDRLEGRARCDPVFYRYSLNPQTELPPPPERAPQTCTDLLETLWGVSEGEIRQHGQSVRFLGHRMFLNTFLLKSLAAVEIDLRMAASRDRSVAEWIDELEITYSFINRGVAGSETRSHHSWGMALDLVPKSYEGQAVYWRWSRVFNREAWHQIPLSRRWSPPRAVIETFERHGWVWGGKWTHFDNIHFEYRPEIILYNRLLEGESGLNGPSSSSSAQLTDGSG